MLYQYQVNIYNDNNYDLGDFYEKTELIFTETLKIINRDKQNYCIAVIFVDAGKSLFLNKTYRHKNYVPDVLSFPNDQQLNLDDEVEIGDIFICYEKARNQAYLYQHSLLRELSFLFLHGILHCLGYDHQTAIEEEIMFTIQRKVLAKLQINR